MFLCLWINCCHPHVKLATPLQGGGENSQGGAENFRLAICHPPDQNAETASASKLQHCYCPFSFLQEKKIITFPRANINI